MMASRVGGVAQRPWTRWLLPLAIAAGIFVGTSWPRPPNMPGGSDKVIHFTAYALLGASVAWAARARGIVGAMTGVLAVSTLGAVDEWHQQFIPGRSMDALDWTADTAGAACGLSLVTALARRRESVA